MIKMNVKRFIITAMTYFAIQNLMVPVCGYAQDETIQNESIVVGYDFEDGDAGVWQPFGNCGLAIDDTNGHISSSSLRAGNRTAAFDGPSFDCTDKLQPGEEYSLSGWVYLECDSIQNVSFTLKSQDGYGVDTYTQIVASRIEPEQWVNFTGTIVIPEDARTYLLYVECENGSTDFLIDDIYILGESSSVSDSSQKEYMDKYTMDFESDFDGWSARGDLTVARTDEYSKNGTHSIYSTSRKETWNAPMVNISSKIIKGEKYYYSSYVMYNGKEYEESHGFRMELQYTLNGTGVYNLIQAKTAKKGKWTKIEGYFTIPENAQNIGLYIQTDNVENGEQKTINDTMSYYVDTVTIAKADVIKKEQNIKNVIIAVCGIVVTLILLLVGRVLYKRAKKKNEALELVSKDAMTGSYNRNAYEQRIKELSDEAMQFKNMYFALCDVNFLKYLNDNHGHKTGDAALIRCAEILKGIVGKSGKVYRIGGDEFVCISDNSLAEKILEAMEKESKIDEGYPFMVACGFAQYDEEKYPTITDIIAQCDKEMYAHKLKIKAENHEFSRK